jgi:hypothetical protein
MPGNPPTCDCGTCRKCKQREYNRRWRERNPERVRELGKKYREQDPERIKEIQRRYAERHPGRRAAISARWRENNPEREKEVKRAFYQRHAERLRKERLEYRKREPEKERARWTLSNALQAGRIVKGECEIGVDCLGRIEAHHDDYSKPLEVRWFCQRHHARHH